MVFFAVQVGQITLSGVRVEEVKKIVGMIHVLVTVSTKLPTESHFQEGWYDESDG